MPRMMLVSGALVASFSFAMPARTAAAQPRDGAQCEEPTPARSTRRSIIGGIARNAIGRAIGSNSVTSTIDSWVPAQSMLTDAFLDLLDCDEQQQAAHATEDATAQAETQGAGTAVAWRSESRDGVSGTSTVTAVDAPGSDGRRCMTVTDVVIIEGEETRQPKRMCRVPPSARYARV
jgi:hypothetical protein